MSRSKSTISTEIKRGTVPQIKQNKTQHVYLADANYRVNRKASKKPFKKLQASDFMSYVINTFHEKNWSIDAICGYAKTHLRFDVTVSTKTLYNYIELGLIPIKNIDLPEKLKRNTKTTRARKNKMKLGESIENRPDISLIRLTA